MKWECLTQKLDSSAEYVDFYSSERCSTPLHDYSPFNFNVRIEKSTLPSDDVSFQDNLSYHPQIAYDVSINESLTLNCLGGYYLFGGREYDYTTFVFPNLS